MFVPRVQVGSQICFFGELQSDNVKRHQWQTYPPTTLSHYGDHHQDRLEVFRTPSWGRRGLKVFPVN